MNRRHLLALGGLPPVAAGAQSTRQVGILIAGDAEPGVDPVAKVERNVGGLFVQPMLGPKESAFFASKYRLPATSFRRAFAAAGGLLSCGVDQADSYRIVAGYVDRMPKGAASGSLPTQQSTRTEMVINRKTADALGIGLSPTFTACADEIIDQ